MTQEMGYRELKKYDIRVIPVDSPDYFILDNIDPTTNLIRQVLGALSEFEKNSVVAKLRGARQRIKAKKGKCEGRKSLEEIYGSMRFRKLVSKVKKLSDQGFSYAKIAGILAEQGWVQPSKLKPFHKQQIQRLRKLGE